jgi:uncharacterized protein Yka (UPF0111/DUF47 family)
MLRKFLPKEDNFFKLFNEAVKQLVDVTKVHQAILANLENPSPYMQEIQKIERAGGKTIRATFHLLHKTFITPFDRYDIHRLASKLDSIVDAITNNALTIQFYELKILPPEMTIIVNSSHRCAKMLKTAIEQLESLQNTAEILKACDAVSDIRATVQELILTAIGRLFKDENDIKQLLKLREVYDGFKDIMTDYQELANVIRTIVLEYA